MSVEEVRGTSVGDLPGRGKLLVYGLGGVFWTWLSARWAYHNTLVDAVVTALGAPDLIRSEQGVRSRTPWIPTEPFERVAAGLGELSASLGPFGVVVDPVAGLFELAAFATGTGPALAEGAFVTVYLTVLSLALGLVIAVPLSVARTYGGRASATVSLAYTELIRGTPLLAQLFLLQFGLSLSSYFDRLWFVSEAGIPNAPAFVAIVGFTINSAAYQSEYIRSALSSVDSGQLVAARSIGLSRLAGIRHVVLPQGLRYAIPGWTNEFVYLIKYSSLAAFITVPELFRRARNIGSDTFQFTDVYVVAAVFYLILVLTAAAGMGVLERRVAVPGVGDGSTDAD